MQDVDIERFTEHRDRTRRGIGQGTEPETIENVMGGAEKSEVGIIVLGNMRARGIGSEKNEELGR
jgi:hypothetical protein